MHRSTLLSTFAKHSSRHSTLWIALLRTLCCLGFVAVCRISVLEAQESTTQEDHFENHVRPLLVKNCIQCHGQTKREAGLDLSSLDGVLRGGDSGPAMAVGKSDESLIVEALRHQSLQMPPDKKLDDAAVDQIVRWINDGAYWPTGQVLKVVVKITDEDRQWWCMQPIRDPAPPMVANPQWCRNEIDQFILKRLESEGLAPSEAASPSQLYRRAHLAVTGLPPKFDAKQIEQLAQPSGYDQWVDELLNQKSYGENQARYWLDLVRYAESDGYRADAYRPAAQQYRDYVIESFNADKPYDRFIMEQLAGDEIDPSNRQALVGTMFLRHWIYEHNQRDVEGQWQEILDDLTETTADAFLALGLKCARCHDHKYDPLLQKDFFRLQAYFAAMHPREDLPVGTIEEREKYLKEYEAWELATRKIRLALYEIENPVLLAHATREGFEKFVPEIKAMVLKQPYERTPREHQIATLTQRQYDLQPEKLPEWLDKEKLAKRQELLDELAKFDSIKPQPLPTQPFVATDVGPIAPPMHIVGDREKVPVEPGPPSIIDDEPAEIVSPHPALQTTGRRTALAKWIASPENPLTARVIVNRVWEQHFGVGLAENASDFGRLGESPSHPELLDWLASRFIEDGWSLKRLHQRILKSATYRQSSVRVDSLASRIDPSRIDPSNRLLWRMNPRRLSGEEIVDAMLTSSGELSKGTKRAIYEKVMRNNLHPLTSLFDFPDRIRSVSKRHRTITSTQALMLMNNDWIRERAIKLLNSTKNLDSAEFVAQAHERVLGRSASEEEIASALAFMQDYSQLAPEPAAVEQATDEPKSADQTIQETKPSASQVANQVASQMPKPDAVATDVAKPDVKTSTPNADPNSVATNEPIVGASGKNKPKDEPKKADGKAASKEKAKEPEIVLSPQEQARVALLHALLNSNEMIYVD